MTRVRPRRQRAVSFEALEGRLALSTGMAVAPPHFHDAIVRASQRKIPASFRGHVSTSGSTVTTTNLRGTIGGDHFTGYGTGTAVGKQFAGGNVYLSNSQGTIQLAVGATQVVHAGRAKTRTFGIEIVAATGKYASFAEGTGTLTKWNVPIKPNATASFSGFFNG
jgi:hypothetical protein